MVIFKWISIVLTFSLLGFALGEKYYSIESDGLIRMSSSKDDILAPNPKVVASMVYENNVNKTGWANLDLRTYGHFSEEEQSYSAGVLEGFVTGDLIAMFYRSLFEDFCDEKKGFCDSFKKFLEENNIYVKKQIETYGKTNAYWHHLSLVYKQLEGLEEGFQRSLREKNLNNYIPNEDKLLNVILMLNFQSEIDTLEDFLTPEVVQNHSSHCSAIIKPLEDGSDLFVAHNTWSSFDTMLRVMKKYSFAFKSMEDNSKLIPGHSVSFPSYPGFISSSDDYYVLSSGLVIQETTIDNYNKSLWLNIKPNKIVFEFMRNVIANRLADSGKEWTEIFGQQNSGTYNNQFMITDYKKFKNGTQLKNLENGLLWVLEQMPGNIRAEDVTHVVREQGYWASYNVPYFKDIFVLSGNEKREQKDGPYFSHKSTARALIFSRDQNKVKDLKSLYKLMRYNDFKNDPLSQCSVYNKTCIPPYSADFAIAARNDLNDANGKYALYDWTFRGEGAIDVKLTDLQMVRNLEMIAVCGPTNEQQPAFQWSKSAVKDLKHEGQPDLFNFKPIHVKWFPSYYQNITDF